MNAPDRKHLYLDTELCQYLLDNVATPHALEIHRSKILGAGTALFTTKNIAEGEEIFRSRPMVNCAGSGLGSVCDYCYMDTESQLHPSGRFRRRDDPIQKLWICECGVCSYCSESCQDSAWRNYHEYECELLEETPDLAERTRALCRILVQEQSGLLSTQQWQLLNSLESHYDDRLIGASSEDIKAIAKTAAERTETDLSIADVSRIYCTLLTNNICIREAGQSKVLGTSLDVMMSLMNHSCDPNVLTIFEGSELCVRSLRPILAGEELLQCYADVTCDVLMRQKSLWDQFLFTCTCPRCERELDDHKRRVSGDMSRIQLVYETQERLTKVINDAILETMMSPETVVVEDLEANVRRIADELFPVGHWPLNLDPIPLLWKTTGNMSSIQGNQLAALRYAIKGCAYTDIRMGQEWNNDLLDLIKILVPCVLKPPSSSVFCDNSFPGSRELRDAYQGYLGMLLLVAEKTFGSTTCYTRAVKKWHNDTVEFLDQSLPEKHAFDGLFKAAHSKLLAWAGVDEKQWMVTGT